MSVQQKRMVDYKPKSFTPQVTRRNVLIGGAASVALMGIAPSVLAFQSRSTRTAGNGWNSQKQAKKDSILTKDGTRLYFKDWGTGTPVVFSHGWPLNADAWDAQMLFLGHNGYRVIAHDRRGHGRSGQSWSGNDINTYADDLAQLMDALDLKGTMLVGHSTGGGEVTRYVGRHGNARLSKLVLISAIPRSG